MALLAGLPVAGLVAAQESASLTSPQKLRKAFFSAVLRWRRTRKGPQRQRALRNAVNRLAVGVNQSAFAAVDASKFEQAYRSLLVACDSPKRVAAGEYVSYEIARWLARRSEYARAVEILERYAKRPNAAKRVLCERAELQTSCYSLLNRHQEARRFLRRFVEPEVPGWIADKANYGRQLAIFYGIRGDLYLQNGLIDLAAKDFKSEWGYAKTTGDPGALWLSTRRRIDLALQSGNGSRALRYLNAYREVSSGTGTATVDDVDRERRDAQLLVFEGMSFALQSHSGDEARSREAVRAFEHALASGHLDRWGRLVAHLKLFDLAIDAKDLESAAAHEAECTKIFAAADEGDGKREDSQLAEHAAYEGLRSRLLLARGATVSVDQLEQRRKDHEKAFHEALDAWVPARPRRGGVGLLYYDHRRDGLGALIDLVLAIAAREKAADGAAQALALLLDVQRRNSVARHREVPGCSVADAQRDLLRRGAGALVYLPARTATHVFVVDRDRVNHLRLAGSTRVGYAVDEFLAALAPSTAKQRAKRLLTKGKALRDLLLPTELKARVVGWTGLTIVGNDLLGNVPFEAFPLRDGRLLGEVVAVDTLSSIPLGVHLARKQASKKHGFAIFATLSPGKGGAKAKSVGRLPVPRAGDFNALIAAHKRELALLCIDTDATFARFVEVDWRQYDIVQLVAHGVQDRGRELGNGLALTDRVLLPEDKLFQALAVRGLWIVSACESASSRARFGDGANATNLGGALLWQGAEAVVLSDVPIHFRAHMKFARVVHEQLMDGSTPAEALRDARAALAAGRDAYARGQQARVRVFGLGQRSLR